MSNPKKHVLTRRGFCMCCIGAKAAALTGGFVGTQVGMSWASGVLLQRLLGVVLLIAGLKFLWV